MIGFALTIGAVLGFFIVAALVAFLVLLDGWEVK